MPATSANVIRLLAGLGPPRAAAAEVAERAHPAAAGAPGEVDEQANQQDHRAEAKDQAREEAAALVDRLGLDGDVLVLEQLGQLVAVGEHGDLGLERLGRLVILVLEVLLEHPVDGRAGRRDAVDVAVTDLLEEGRAVRHPDRLDLAGGEQRDEDVVGREQRDDDEEDPHAGRPEAGALALAVVLLGERRAGLAFAGLRIVRHGQYVAASPFR